MSFLTRELVRQVAVARQQRRRGGAVEISDYTDSADDPEVSQRVVAAIQSGLREHNLTGIRIPMRVRLFWRCPARDRKWWPD